MWRCPHCSEMSEAAFDSCWKCGTGKDGSPPLNTEAYRENPQPTGLAFETPCPICGGSAFSWGNVQGHYPLVYKGAEASLLERVSVLGGHSVNTRLCSICGNLQLFVQEFVEQPPQV